MEKSNPHPKSSQLEKLTWRDFSETNHAVMLLIDPADGSIVDANQAACAFYGWSREELKRKKISEINCLPLKDVSSILQNAASEKQNQFIFQHKRADGSVADVEVFSGPIQFQDRDLLFSIIHDITERKRLEAAISYHQEQLEGIVQERTQSLEKALAEHAKTEQLLQESEQRYRELIDETNSIVLEWDTQGNVVYLNKFGLKFFGFAEHEILNRNVVGTIVEKVSREGEDLQGKMQVVQKEPEKFYSSENENVCKDGSRVWIAWTNKGIYSEEGRLIKTRSVGVDHTEQHKMEEQLKRSYDLLSMAQEISSSGTWEWNPVDNSVQYSEGLLKVFGLKKIESATFEEGIKCILPEDREKVLDTIRMCLKENKPISSSFRIIWPNGEIRWVKANAAPRLSAGQLVSLIGICQDITEFKKVEDALYAQRESLEETVKKRTEELRDINQYLHQEINERTRAEEQLRQRTEKLEEAQRIAGIAEWEFDIQSQVFNISRLLDDQYQFETSRPHSLQEWMESVHPEDFEEMGQYFNRDVIGNHKPVDKQFRIITKKDRSTKWLQVNGRFIYDADGNPIKIIGTSQDITERKKAEISVAENERLFRSTFEQAAVGMTQTSIDGVYLQVNAKFCDITGYTFEDVKKITYRDITHPDDLAKDNQLFDQMVAGEHNSYSIEKRYIRKDGKHILVKLTVSLVRDEKGAPQYTIGIIEDISEKRKIEEALGVSENKYRSLFETANDAIMVLSEGLFIDCNKKTEALFACTKEEFIGSSLADFSPKLQPDGSASKESAAKKISLAITEGPQFFEWRHARKDGSTFLAEVNLNKFEANGKSYLQAIVRDIDEKKKAEEKIIESEARFRASIQNSPAGIIISLDGVIQYVNPAMEKLLGFSENELIGFSPKIYIHPDDYKLVDEKIAQRISGMEKEARYEIRTICKNGELKHIEVFGALIQIDGKPATIAYLIDVTERKKAEQEILETNAKFQRILDNLQDAYFQTDQNGKFTLVSPSAAALYGHASSEDMLGLPASSLYADANDRNALIEELRETGSVRGFQCRGLRTDGTSFWVSMNVQFLRDKAGQIIGTEGLVRDISEIKEKELLQQTLLEKMPVGQVLVDAKTRKVEFANATALSMAKYANMTEILGKPCNQVYCAAGDDTCPILDLKQNMDNSESVLVCADGSRKPIIKTVVPIELQGKKLLLESFIDISERKQAEAALQKHAKILEESQNIGRLGSFEFDISTGIFKSSTTLQDIFGITEYHDVTIEEWASMLHPDDRQILLDYLMVDVIKKHCVCDKEHRIMRVNDQKVRWVHVLGRLVFDEQGKPSYLQGTTQDITEIKDYQLNLQNSLARLNKSFAGIIETTARIVEARDPYTAGHQKHVADIANAIAMDMRLSEDQVRGVYFAGLIHDLGKIQVPAEILSKPGVLTDPEYDLIKTHPQVGYDLLKTIDFPWPIAEMVYQHHERMDGSGYPNKLKGEQIMLEARILVVADVIEAISSHRPYRPALGFKAALREIKENKGLFYDERVVASVERLKRKGFPFHFE